MQMDDVARSMMKRFRTDDGRSFYGELVKPAPSTRPDNFDHPRRILRTGAKSNVNTGNVMLTSNGRRYLLADHDDVETTRLDFRMFQLFELIDHVTWKRPTTVNDTVTGLGRETAPTDLGLVYVAYEQPAIIQDATIRNRQTKYRVVTKEVLQIGDILDDKLKVIMVWMLLGVPFAEVE
jgi:hypothetical protein